MSTRKEVFQNRLVTEVEEYYRVFSKPMPLKIISAKFSRALNSEGGFSESVAELKNSNRLAVYMHESGSKLVAPFDATISLPGFVKL